MDVIAGLYGPAKIHRAVVVTTDPLMLPGMSTRYLISNFPLPGSGRAKTAGIRAARVEEIVRLYGVRMWVEQSYKQVKGAMGWAEYHVRADQAIQWHCSLVYCAFTFCWWHASHTSANAQLSEGIAPSEIQANRPWRENGQPGAPAPWCLLASRIAAGSRLVGAMDQAWAVLASVVETSPTLGPSAGA